MAISFRSLSAIVKPGEVYLIAFEDPTSDVPVVCRVIDYDESGLVIDSGAGSEFVSIDLIKLIKPQTVSGVNSSPPNRGASFDAEPDVCSNSENISPVVEAAPDSTKNGLVTSSHQIREASECIRTCATPLPEKLSPPNFDMKFSNSDEQKELNRAKSRYEYAIKIGDAARIVQIAQDLSRFSRSHQSSPQFHGLIGTLALEAGLFELASVHYEKSNSTDVRALYCLLVGGRQDLMIGRLLSTIGDRVELSPSEFSLLAKACDHLRTPPDDLIRASESCLSEPMKAQLSEIIEFIRQKNKRFNGSDNSSSSLSGGGSPLSVRQGSALVSETNIGTGVGIVRIHDPIAGRGLLHDAARRQVFSVTQNTQLDDLTAGALKTPDAEVRVRYRAKLTPGDERGDGEILSTIFIELLGVRSASRAQRSDVGLPSSDTIYGRAKIAERERKFDQASKLFLDEIRTKGKQAESALKDLANLYLRREQIPEAIALLKEHAALVTNYRAYHNTMAHVYLKGKQFGKAVEQYSEVLRLSSISPTERLIVRRNIASAFAQSGEIEKARDLLQAILAENPNDDTTRYLLENIDAYGESLRAGLSSRSNGVNELLDRLKLGVSAFQYHFIEGCDFSVLDERARSRGYFVNQDFIDVETEIRKIGSERKPKRRGEYYLTLAAMSAKSDGVLDDEMKIYEYLANYFANWAEHAINDRFHVDAVRSLLIESMQLSNEYQLIERCAKLLLILYSDRTLEANDIFGKSKQSISKLINDVTLSEDAALTAIGFLGRLVSQNPAASRLTSAIEEIRLALPLSLPSASASPDAKMVARARHGRDLRGRSEEIASLSPIALKQLKDHLLESVDTLDFELDRRKTRRLSEIIETCLRLSGEQEYTDKESSVRQVLAELQEIGAEISGDAPSKYEAGPTHWLIEVVLPILEKLSVNVESHFKAFRSSATSVVRIEDSRAQGFYRLNDKGRLDVDLEVVVSGNSPIEALELNVFAAGGESSRRSVAGALRSNESKAVSIEVYVPEKDRQAQIVSIDVEARFEERSSGRARVHKAKLPIRVGSAEFERIENRFSKGSSGKPVEDPTMFFGREELLDEIEATIARGDEGGSFVIYGQQRSGKTSVLKQLQKRIERDCLVIELSFGSFGLTLQALAMRILDNIAECLADKQLHAPRFPEVSDITRDPHGSCIKIIRETRRIGGRRIVFLVDEFTYLNSEYLDPVIKLEILRFWKAMLQDNLFSVVIAAQNSWPSLKRNFSNQLAVSKEVQISFLSREMGERLAVDPILYQGKSRYLQNAVSRLNQLTGGSPYFTQRMCDEVVKYLNLRKDNFISDAHLEYVVRKILNEWDLDDFKSQFTVDDTDSADSATIRAYLRLLSAIAGATKAGPCAISDVALDDEARRMIDDGVRRLELETHPSSRISIRVGLFAEFLRDREA